MWLVVLLEWSFSWLSRKSKTVSEMCTHPYISIELGNGQHESRNVSDWAPRSVICSLLHMWYHYVAEHNSRIVSTKDSARLSRANEVYLHTLHLVAFAEWPTKVRVPNSHSFFTSKCSYVTSDAQDLIQPSFTSTSLIRTEHLLLHTDFIFSVDLQPFGVHRSWP
jgi:hypothetical protein